MGSFGVRSKILIVDDTPSNIQVLAVSLGKDYEVFVATDGLQALDMANRIKPDLILLDIMMPEMDGYEVCSRLKSSMATQNIPVIFVSAKATAADEEKGLNLGAIDYITKPFHMPVVKARVRNHLDLKAKADLLEGLAHIDGLTNIPNRRRFDEMLEIEWGRALRNHTSLALVIADIDYFKRFNDCYGHGGGDQCLQMVAQTLASCVRRPADFVARYGGEEFVAILPDADFKGAEFVAEQWRATVESLQIPHEYSGVSDYVTLSVGFAVLVPTQNEVPFLLLGKADEMLYQAKEDGRNCVCGVDMAEAEGSGT